MSKLGDLTVGGRAALEDAIAPALPDPAWKGAKRANPDVAARELPGPVLNAVYAGLSVINGPKGSGMQWRSARIPREDQKDQDNVAEWSVMDPWGDLHVVVKMSEKSLEKNIRAYSERVQLEILNGEVEKSRFFARRVSAIVHETLLTGEWICQPTSDSPR